MSELWWRVGVSFKGSTQETYQDFLLGMSFVLCLSLPTAVVSCFGWCVYRLYFPTSWFSLFFRTLMASTHVNHNIYITEVKTGKCVHSLVGHRRTPWCVTFHPTIPGLIASGCLDGEVRIWDLHVSSF